MRFGLVPDATASPLRGSITPILRWLQYADHRVARLCRSCTGSITAIIRWLDYADPGMARICRSVTPGEQQLAPTIAACTGSVVEVYDFYKATPLDSTLVPKARGLHSIKSDSAYLLQEIMQA